MNLLSTLLQATGWENDVQVILGKVVKRNWVWIALPFAVVAVVCILGTYIITRKK